jgi:hypothetical protein
MSLSVHPEIYRPVHFYSKWSTTEPDKGVGQTPPRQNKRSPGLFLPAILGLED